MTTERELAEWPEKIRRVRGQSPLYSGGSRPRQSAVWFRVILFVGGLAIALAVSNHLQKAQQSESQPPIIREYRP
ncbi:hypothetical protein [[Limnothrix rosea] IAM M-220]|uniref:hypothetical protein n=1 Tax=[Limnothrix rosea] IAM M-220 TaxID=454133 RepID=UPI0009662709|nr:hypothetical protein [[Limnothrix rosea] IAM M-220]OKH18926.1 hypothetical protein NIES208_04225 [[Limnothrix rosea] IAM M-220]